MQAHTNGHIDLEALALAGARVRLDEIEAEREALLGRLDAEREALFSKFPALRGRRMSPETREKMSAAAKARWQRAPRGARTLGPQTAR